MKKLFLLPLMVAAVLVSCNNAKKANTDKAEVTATVVKAELKTASDAKTVTEIFKVAENMVGKEVVVKGKVSHVCQHSGKKCFLKDAEGNTLKINANEEINVFPKELSGKNIEAKGILRMTKIDKAKIDAMAKEEDHCDTESSNVTKMRAWMKKNNKDYFAFYYVDGKEYKEIK